MSRVPAAANPRWSLTVAPLPDASMAGEPEMRAWVRVEPPLSARVVLRTAVIVFPLVSRTMSEQVPREPELMPVVVPRMLLLSPLMLSPNTSFGLLLAVFPAMMLLRMVKVPPLR
ncbi:hypothetical protein [Baaleninema sp.]|uniref:hypothetical protein n=1 Tax=Baaleninema sp. TaxID=3101197 RepID=UPI003D03028A